jgi:hypothetical protein
MPEIGVKSPKNVPPRLKPHSIYWLYTGVKTPVSLRIEFFRSLFKPPGAAAFGNGVVVNDRGKVIREVAGRYRGDERKQTVR